VTGAAKDKIRSATEDVMATSNGRTGSLMAGAALIGLGLLFLVGQFLGANVWRLIWPLALVGAGGLFFVGMVTGGKASAGLAIPGSILSTLGLLMLYQNLSGHWASWAYAWTLIVVAVGAGVWLMGRWSQDEDRARSGLRLAGVGVALFVVFGAFFELGAMLLGARGPAQLLFPILLILVGLYLVAARSGLLGRRAAGPTQMPEDSQRPETPGPQAG
jgi:hypothetical protein